MSKLTEATSALSALWDKVRESELYQQLKGKYEELDPDTRLYINFGAAAGVAAVIVISVLSGIASVNSLKSQINDRDEMIGYLENTSDTIKRFKAQQEGKHANTDTTSPLNTFVENVQHSAGFDRVKMEIGKEIDGTETKEAKERLVDVKMSQTNLRQITRFLFEVTKAGKARNLIVHDLTIDTQGDPLGYMDASFKLAGYLAKEEKDKK